MTGKSSDAGQTGQSPGRRVTAVPSGLAALAAGSLLAALGLSACGPDAAHAATVLRSARAATVQLADGSNRAGTDGMTIPKGATVRTAPGGSAALVAAGRTVLLGSATGVTVIDGAHEQLRQGLVMIDARRAPGLALDAGAATVQTSRGGLARVERGAVLRAASFARTLTVRATGRKAQRQVHALHQVQVPDGGRPGVATALALTRDAWERRYALDLVTADIDIASLADGLDRNPASRGAVVAALPSSYSTSAVTAAGESRSEVALAFVVAKAVDAGGSTFGRIRELRAEGGSWGVVAALVGADVTKVSAALDALLNATGGPAALTASVGGPVAPGGLLGGTPQTAGPVGTPSGLPGPSTRPTRRPTPAPSPSSDPVQDVVDTVTHLLPTPTPTPLGGLLPRGTTPSPTPLLSVQLGGLGLSVGG
jgi:hypothetical protein